jgi:elongation factor Ts
MKMAEITASMVKELRERTGLGMMECKKALEESGGDLKKAEELLRIKSGAKASKAAARVASEGAVGIHVAADAKLGAMVEVNCETDFVARNPISPPSLARWPNASPARNPLTWPPCWP